MPSFTLKYLSKHHIISYKLFSQAPNIIVFFKHSSIPNIHCILYIEMHMPYTLHQEAWLAEAFNCHSESTFSASGSAGPVLALEDDILYAPGSGSDSEASCFEASDESILMASDEDEPVAKRAKVSEERPAKRQYSKRDSQPSTFLGMRVCRNALARLLGVGGSTLARIRHGEKVYTNKLRPGIPKHPTFGFSLRGECGAVWEQVVSFLWCIYHSSAEVMPNNYKIPGHGSMETPLPDKSTAEDDDAMARILNGFQLTLHTKSSDPELNMIGPGTFAGPMRALPHGSRTELFWEYCAFCDARGQSQASYSTFLRVANPILKPGEKNGHLRFRQPTEHSQCDVCFGLKRDITRAKTDDARREAMRSHHRHILSQWMDRQCYWSFRSMSHAVFAAIQEQGARLLSKLVVFLI